MTNQPESPWRRPNRRPPGFRPPTRGDAIYNRAHDRVGRIDKLSIDPNTREVDEVTLSFGGLFGLGARRQTVPVAKLAYEPSLHGYVVPLTVDLRRMAPSLDVSRLAGWDQLPRGIVG